MKKTIEVTYRDYNYNEEVDLPNKCPHCGMTMIPHVIYASSNEECQDWSKTIGVFLQCSDSDCSNYFSERYVSNPQTNSKFKIIPNTYRPPIIIDLPENIDKVSRDFVEIYSQATEAESRGLDQIAGVGYRKSLEFLIKDHLIRINPEEEDSIKSKMLGPVISKYLGDFPKLQNLARAATWIGNDETHYIKRHDDKDIRDMKQFIRSASQFIAADYDADLAMDFTSQS